MSVEPPNVTIVEGRCWWCGAVADSREHRLKASDLVREFGKPPFTSLRTLTHLSGEDRHDFQGPRSGVVKFSASMCKACNNARSQPFDVAWDAFGLHVAEHEGQLLADEAIDWAEVYGSDWRVRGADWERYVLKHAVCRLVDEGEGPITLAGDLVEFLNGGDRPSYLEIRLTLDQGIVAMLRATRANPDPDEPEAAEAGFLGTTRLAVMKSRSTGAWSTPQAGLYYRFVGVLWRIGDGAASPFDHQICQLPKVDDFFGPGFRAALEAYGKS